MAVRNNLLTHTLRPMQKSKVTLLAVLLLSGATAFAGSFSTDFSNPNPSGWTPNAVGTLPDGTVWLPMVANGVLVLTSNANSLQGAIDLDSLDNDPGTGQPLAIESFTARFQLQFGPGTGNAADGASFNFGPDISSASIFTEEGPGTGSSDICVEFDTYDNGGNEAPAVDIKLFGVEIAHTSYAKADMVDSKLENVFIQVKRNGTMSVAYKDQTVYTNFYLPGWGSTNGIFNISARTGGENELTLVDNLNITTVVAPATPVKPSITADPQNVTVNEGSSTTFTVGFDGNAPFTFQWYKNGTAIQDATNTTLVLNPVHFVDNGAKIKCTITNGSGSATSAEATLTVIADTTKPTIVSATGSEDFTHATITFSEPMDQTSVQTVGNYTIPGLTVSAANQVATDPTKVVLTTSPQTAGSTYTITVNNVKDQATTPNTIAANSQVTFYAWVIANGICKAEYFNNIGTGTAVSDLTSSPKYIANAPDLVYYHVSLDASESYINGNVDGYGARVTGWIIPTTTGDYDFFIRSDDASQLFLSTDSTPGNLSSTPICEETSCCHAFQEPPAATTTGAPIHLIGGQRYYYMALLKEGTGGDYVQVAMRLSGDTTPAGSLKPISGINLAAAVSPEGATLAITQQPASQTGVDGKSITFSIAATGSSIIGNTVLYQWQRNGTPIAGATGDTYGISALTLADSGAQFNVLVWVPGKTLTSSTATLTVIPDTFPPIPLIGTITKSDGTIQVGVGFDEAVNPAGLVPGNFSLVDGTGTLVFPTNSLNTYTGVLFNTTGLVPGNTYHINVKNVADLKGNAITSTNVAFTVGKTAWADSGTPIRPGQVVPVGSDGFDVLNGGRQEWGTYDEITMAFVKKTNDFDVKIQVIYAEPASEWTRVGLQARYDMNVGEPTDDRNIATGTASAYAQTHVNPSQTLASSGVWDPNDPVQPGNPTPNNGHEQNCRLAAGATTQGWGSPGGTPNYPNVWLRLSRSGTTLHGYRSEDGKNWTDQGTVNLTDQFPVMNVGPFLGVETGNIWTSGFDIWTAPLNPTYDRLFLAQFRNFADIGGVVVPVRVTITQQGNNIVLSWPAAGTLQQSTALGAAASWTAVSGAPNTPTGGSYTNAPAGKTMFYRLLQQ